MTPFETFYLMMIVIGLIILATVYISDHRKKRSKPQ
jgi:hypothetical protein